ncbi:MULTISPECIES: dockerin type I repeat-containing protein [unclassified Psychrosphaera]|uniref:dockerin type I repeat-containing protein n=1 Tax=unclassified Psychrosphaera TaxID=2641570 RepID=UPI00209057C5|nr:MULTISPECIES: dockerin type I repeat-containing protein [unclassified Psychrosphaera]
MGNFQNNLIGLATICLLAFATNHARAQSISVDASDVKQTITMMGGDMERSGSNLQNAANKEEIIDWLVKDIPFDTWRIAYNKNQEIVEGTKNWAYYDDELAAMQLIKNVNPNMKFFATLESDYHGYSQGNRNNLPTWIYDYSYENGAVVGTKTFNAQKYGIFLADYVEFMEQSGFPLTYIATSKEYIGVITPWRAKTIIATLKSELAARNVNMPLIIDAGTWSLTSANRLINGYENNNLIDDVHGFSSHDYWSNETLTWEDFATKANGVGKPAFNEESGHGGGGQSLYESDFKNALNAYFEKTRMYAGGIKGEAIFELWPRGYNEIQENKFFAKPIFFNNGSDGRRMRSYYIMKKFATAAVDSVYVNSSTTDLEDVSTMAFRKGDEMALWVINQSNNDYNSVDFNISEFGLKNGMDVRQTYWSETTEIEGVETRINLDAHDHFTANAKANSISVFILKPQYTLTPYVRVNDGNWVQTDDVTVTEGDTVDFGPQSRIANTWTWQGPANFSTDQRKVRLENITPAMAGEYLATYSSYSGFTSDIITTLKVDCDADPVTTPYYQINDSNWVGDQNTATLEAGDSIKFGPQSQIQGDWHWSGPNNFSHSGRQPELTNVKPDMAGTYVATYTSPQGCSTNLDYHVIVNCSVEPTIIPWVQLNGAWSRSTSLDIKDGDSFKIGPNSPNTGRWQWTGPNDFKAMEVRQLSFVDVGEEQGGQYEVTFTTPQGCVNSTTFEANYIPTNVCTPPKVTPYLRVNTGSWSSKSAATLAIGDSIDIGPQPNWGGTWAWTGPDGYSSDIRQIHLDILDQSQAGTYYGTYTKNDGCSNTVEIAIAIETPEPLVGDINNDGDINSADIAAFIAVYGLKSTDEGYLVAADLDGDGIISRLDYSQLYSIYRQQ